ncbi:MAG: hypothetical protein VKP62_04400 [Candidatus Sericytochromatia bacterium]|nr:hypothetical protein [Candidatus Sericytochromatia bacterium]
MNARWMLGALLGLSLSLTGCGKNPSAAAPQRSGKVQRNVVPVVTPTPPPRASQYEPAAPSVNRMPGAPAVVVASQVPAPAAEAGALRVKVRTLGSVPAASLRLRLSSQADPTMSALVPLALTGAAAQWETEDLGAGAYDLQLDVRDAADQSVGTTRTVARVVAGEITELSLDVTLAPPAASAPAGNPSATGTSETGAGTGNVGAAETPPTATGTTGMGGSIGIRVEFQ